MTSHKMITIIVTCIIIYNTIVRVCIFRAGCHYKRETNSGIANANVGWPI